MSSLPRHGWCTGPTMLGLCKQIYGFFFFIVGKKKTGATLKMLEMDVKVVKV